MIQWEYKVDWYDFSTNTEEYSEFLLRKGKEGWDNYFTFWLESKRRMYHYFKRPIPQPSTAERIFNEVKNEVEGGHMDVKTTS